MSDVTPEQLAAVARLHGDLPLFAAKALNIRTKSGEVVPFRFNRAQTFVDAKLEEQRERLGYIRAIVVKARQQGFSTYAQGRFYHRLWRTGGSKRAFILTHSDDATSNLFRMAKGFQALHPAELLQPRLKAGNAKELIFEHNGSGYAVATAGNAEVGRSATFQYFHGSEVAFWPNADNHVAASMQAVGRIKGTEVILESTANGIGNFFHRTAMAALRGQSDFELIFTPWHWSDEYAMPCPDAWDPPDEWMQYAQLHKLTWEQLYWAYCQNRIFAQAEALPDDAPSPKFRQEYPATVEEAFQSSGNSFIPSELVVKAMKRETEIVGHGPVILGVDPSRNGDKVGVIDRCGRRMGSRIAARIDPGGSVVYVADQIGSILNRIRPDVCNIDVGGVGAGVYDILVDRGYKNLNAVNFGSKPISAAPTGEYLYQNRRAEMYDAMREWFATDAGVQIPDDDGLQGDICGPQWGAGATRYQNSNGMLIIEEKDKIRARLGASPDLGDAAALTFAVPVAHYAVSQQTVAAPHKGKRKTGY